MDNYYFCTRTKNNICPICLLLFFKTIQLKCEHTFRIVQNIFLQFSVYDIFFWLKDSISKSLTAFQGFISYGANNFIHEFFIQEEEPLLRLYFKIIDDFLKNTWRDYHYKCSSKNLFYHPCISLSYNSQSESVSRWSFKNELFGGNCFEVK